MGRIECDVRDCIQSRQDYMIAVKRKEEKKRQVTRRITQEVRQHCAGVAALCKMNFWLGNTLAAHRSFEELQGEAFWFGGLAGAAVMMTGSQNGFTPLAGQAGGPNA